MRCSKDIFVIMKQADWGTKRFINGGVLEDVVQEGDFSQFGVGGDPKNSSVEMVILFILNYSRHAAPKETVKMNVLKSQEKKKIELGRSPDAANESSMAECHLDFLTSSDVAYTLWQFFNSHEDWTSKLKGEEKGDNRYKCNTRFTKERSKFAEGDANSEGMKLYKQCHDWAKKLKNLEKEDMETFRYTMNSTAVDLGLLKGFKKKSRPICDWADDEAQESIPVFCLDIDDDEVDMVGV